MPCGRFQLLTFTGSAAANRIGLTSLCASAGVSLSRSQEVGVCLLSVFRDTAKILSEMIVAAGSV